MAICESLSHSDPKQFDMCLSTPGWKSREFSLSIRLSMALLAGPNIKAGSQR
jgi:hypothetical protein